MRAKFCQYCGESLDEGCSCIRDIAQAEADFIEEYESRPDVQYGWVQQDLIDMHRFER